ncbi:MAG TPA: NAD(P)H-binding protein, partial [Opitutaceae bacterium]
MPQPSEESPGRILVTGGTGYLGRALMPQLVIRGYDVRALVRPESVRKLPPGVDAVVGNALLTEDVAQVLTGCPTLVHLVRIPKPAPSKARQFREIDLVSIQASVAAATRMVQRPHLVYLSVAQPASMMKAFIQVRAQGEALIRRSGLDATLLRPWYVLGPGHRWPYLLLPLYALMECFPATRPSAQRLALVTLPQMVAALVNAVENPA